MAADARSGQRVSRQLRPRPDTTGLDYIRGQLLRDIAALNRVEVGPWDVWAPDTGDRVLDEAAPASADAGDGTHAAALWVADPELAPPAEYRRDP